MVDQDSFGSFTRSLSVPGIAALLLVTWLVQYIWNRPTKLKVPVVKFQEGRLMETVAEGKNKYPNQPFTLDTLDDTIILPITHLDEIRDAPEDKINFPAFLEKHNLASWTRMRIPPEEIVSAVKNDLTRNIGKVLVDLQEELKFITGNIFKDCPTWTPLQVNQVTLPIVAGLSARTFVGLPLCRDPEWIQATITYTGSTVAALMKLQEWPAWARPIVAPFLPAIRKLETYSQFGAKKLKPQLDPIVDMYLNKTDRRKATEAESVKGDFNMVHWIVNNTRDVSKVSAHELGTYQMSVAFASIHTTAMTLSQVLFDLAAHPEYVQDLRDELNGVLAEENFPDGMLRKTSMPKLKKMDSFLKESQRMNPPSPLQFQRQVVAKKGLKLSNGLVIPHGTAVVFPAPYLPHSKVPADNLINNTSQPSLEEFAPWRFSELRNVPGEASKHQFVSVNEDNTVFGVGPHACPGRFFAGNEIKLILAAFLKEYDVALGPNGEGDGQNGYTRPPSLQTRISNAPNYMASIYIRSRPKA